MEVSARRDLHIVRDIKAVQRVALKGRMPQHGMYD